MPAMTLENLTRRFPGGKNESEFTAVGGLTFEIQRGEVFGFLGPNGAGKTTTIRMLTALITPSQTFFILTSANNYLANARNRSKIIVQYAINRSICIHLYPIVF